MKQLDEDFDSASSRGKTRRTLIGPQVAMRSLAVPQLDFRVFYSRQMNVSFKVKVASCLCFENTAANQPLPLPGGRRGDPPGVGASQA